MKTFKKYFKVWWLMSRNSFLNVAYFGVGGIVFILGKALRFFFFVFFLVFLLKGTKSLAGYDLNQVLFFFLTFNLVDVTSQFFFREVYRFRPMVVSGSFDLVLVKPMNALFRSLMGGADILDLFTIPPLIIAIIWFGRFLNPTTWQVILYGLLIINGLIVAAAFHIAVLALGILTLEIDHTIMIFRDLSSLGRFPVDIYKEPLRGTLTYLVPIGIMMTFPAKALMGLLSPWGILSSFVAGAVFLLLAFKFWNYALTKYSSASS
jgi:ABC-2 type transport system permease protein